MQIKRYTDEWWFEPDLKPRYTRLRVPTRLLDEDPATANVPLPKLKQGKVATFKPSRHWTLYNRLHPIDVGYLVPVYPLKDIATRYGLSINGAKYFRKHILPEPFDIVRRRSVHAHHWHRFTLSVLDVVLRDLEDRGYNQFLKSYTDHVALLHQGIAFLEQRYAQIYEDKAFTNADKFGVTWVDD